MLQGVEILTYEVVPIMEQNSFIFLFGWIVAIIILLLAIIIKVDRILGVIIYFLIFGISLGLSICIPQKTGEYAQYKVIISDKVDFNDFHEKYEILEQDGKIYTIKEKDVE